jgi:hypothetical protein
MNTNIVTYINRITAVCFELGMFSPIVTYIDKENFDLTNIPKSRFTGEYADFKLSYDPNSDDYEFDDIYFTIDNLSNYEKFKSHIEEFYSQNYELIFDYPFYTKECLQDTGWTIDEKGNIIEDENDDIN